MARSAIPLQREKKETYKSFLLLNRPQEKNWKTLNFIDREGRLKDIKKVVCIIS